MLSSSDAGYAGDVAPGACLQAIRQRPEARLIDVRTTAEWAYVGAPDPAALGHEPIRIEWQVFPDMRVNDGFVAALAAKLAAEFGERRDAPLYFLCRSGVRSKAAAIAMTQAGFGPCYNVADGFEGPPDPAGRRGAVAGWKAEGLPWRQS